MNILHHEKVIPPLKKDRSNASKTDDSEWAIIPISFGSTKERWSGAGKKCIHVDAYVNTCVANIFRSSAAKIGSISNYIFQKFQQVLKEHYVLHKASVKALKSKRYKAWRGANDVVGDYVLPEGFHVDHYEKVLKKMKDLAKRINPDFDKKPMAKEDVKMPTMSELKKEESNEESFKNNIRIPGFDENKENVKKPLIISSDKYKPNFSMKHVEDDAV